MFDVQDDQRGVIRNRAYKQQISHFKTLRFGKITPTDLDAYIDFGNRLFVFIEGKHGDAQMPYGQNLAFERLCDACHNPPIRYAVSFVTRSDETLGEDIDLGNTIITKYRFEGKWRKPTRPYAKLIDGINMFRYIFMPNCSETFTESVLSKIFYKTLYTNLK